MISKELRQEGLTRQLDLLPLTVLDKSITIIGAGAIGSFTTLSLVKMGFQNVTVIDYDIVDTMNMSCQLYRFKDIGRPKVYALKTIVEDFTNISINIVNDKYTNALITSDILISAVDSMTVRKAIWDSCKNVGFVKKLIDPRMSSEFALLYVMDPSNEQDIKSYEKTLYTDENAMQERCTNKATIYCAGVLSGLVCAQVKSIVTNNPYTRTTQFDIPKGSYNSWQKRL